MLGVPWRIPLKEIPHAHADFVELLLKAHVMPFFFFVLFLLQFFGERVVFPTALAVFFFPDVVAVENVQLVFFFKLCNAVLDDAFDLADGLFHGGCLRFPCVFSFRCLYIRSKTHIYQGHLSI